MKHSLSIRSCGRISPALGTLGIVAMLLLPICAFAGPPFANPPELTSRGGQLQGEFVLSQSPVVIGGNKVKSLNFNGLYCPPTLRLAPGDSLDLTLKNLSPKASNIHYHGLAVTPQGPGDNIHIKVPPGHQQRYQFEIPKRHQPGMYWYHSHAHGSSQNQLNDGLSGAFIVEGFMEKYYPTLEKAGVNERVMVLKDFQKGVFGGPKQAIVTSQKSLRTVNGLKNPTLNTEVGAVEFWRISNQGANIFYRLNLNGLTFYVVAEDGQVTNKMLPRTEYLLGPSSRVEILVQFPKAGTYELTTGKVRTGPDGDGSAAGTLLTVQCAQASTLPAISLPTEPSCCVLMPKDLTKLRPVDERRRFLFSDGEADFRINNKTFSTARIDTRVPLGNLEEWTLVNSSGELHHFHIHQVDFQVTSIDGVPQPFTGYRDTIVMPNFSKVKILINFDDPVILGRFVYHCHILEHEDGGMMGHIEVYDPRLGGVDSQPTNPSDESHTLVEAANPDAKGGAFTLKDHTGTDRSTAELGPDYTLLTFGYARCNGTCPLSVSQMIEWQEALPAAQRDRLGVAMVSIDPEQDTVAVLKEFVSGWDEKLTALSGTAAQLAPIYKDFGVTAERTDRGTYRHSADIYLIDTNGNVVERFAITDRPKALTSIRNSLATSLPALPLDDLQSATARVSKTAPMTPKAIATK